MSETGVNWLKVPIVGMPGTECGRVLLEGGETRIMEDFQEEFGPCIAPGCWMAGMLFLCNDHAAKVAAEFGDDLAEIEKAFRELYA